MKSKFKTLFKPMTNDDMVFIETADKVLQFTSSSEESPEQWSVENQGIKVHESHQGSQNRAHNLYNENSYYSRKRKSREQIHQHYNDYHREYLKKYRLRKKNEETLMKELIQLSINALINVLNANSQFINDEDTTNINSTTDYYDRCRKIIDLINKLYKSSSE